MAVVSIERQMVSATSGKVLCPLRDQQVPVAKCLECGRRTGRDDQEPPRYIVCDARLITGWLGLDD